MASAGGSKLSRDDFRKQKELDTARKAGQAPAEIDEEGKEINPHIPQYISKAPWYLNMGKPTLKHQRASKKDEEKSSLTALEQNLITVKTTGSAATMYRPGACDNCGALTHRARDCVERPRQKGAKWTGMEICQDEVIQDVQLDWDGKRDRWKGYQSIEHVKIAEEWQEIEQRRKQIRAQKVDEKLLRKAASLSTKAGEQNSDDSDSDLDETDDSEDEEKYAEGISITTAPKKGEKKGYVNKNLRIREDKAKFLINLDPDSAFYDPKTRSMRENPLKEGGDEIAPFIGENYARNTGDASKVNELQVFAWEASERGADIHLQANPSRAEHCFKEYVKKKEEMKAKVKKEILDKYGGDQHLSQLRPELVASQSEQYVEYSRTGAIKKGNEKPLAASRYEEDVYPHNHTNVWGSYFLDGKWGYRCCRQTMRNSYCIGLELGDAPLVGSNSAVRNAILQEKLENQVQQQSQETKRPKRKAVDKDVESDSSTPSEEEKLRKKKKKSHKSKKNKETDNDTKKKEKKEKKERRKELKAQEILTEKEAAPIADVKKAEVKYSKGGWGTQAYENVDEKDMEKYRLDKHKEHDPMQKYLMKGQ